MKLFSRCGKLVLIILLVFSLFSVQIVGATVSVFNSTIAQSENTTDNSTTSITNVMIHTLTIPENISGNFSISFKADIITYGGYIQLYKNDVAYGTQFTIGATNTTRIQGFSGQLNTTDVLELRGRVTGGTMNLYNSNIMYTHEYPAGYRVWSFDNLSTYGFNDSFTPARMDVSNGDVRINGSAGATLVLSNDSYNVSDIIFYFTQKDTWGATGIVFNAKNSSSFYHVRYNVGSAWQIYRFGTTTLLRNVSYIMPYNVTVQGRIVLSNNSNSTFYLSYLNGTNIFTTTFDAYSDGWCCGGYIGFREGGSGDKTAIIDNIGINVTEINFTDNVESENLNVTNTFSGTYARYNDSGNWVYESGNNITSGLHFNNISLKNAIITADIKLLGYTTVPSFGLRYRTSESSTDHNNNTYGSNLISTNELNIYNKLMGTTTVLNLTSSAIQTNDTWYRLKILLNGSSISSKIWYKDNMTEPIDYNVSATDTNLSYGFVQLLSVNSHTYFDNISISSCIDNCDYPMNVTNLTHYTVGFDHVWYWNNTQTNFDHNDIYINGTYNSSSTSESFTLPAIAHNTSTISIQTHGINGLVNSTWTNMTSTIANNIPIIDNLSSVYSVTVGGTLQLFPNYTDADGDSITYSRSFSEGSFDTSSGNVTFTPTASDIGLHTWQIIGTDNYSGIGYKSFSVYVSGACANYSNSTYLTISNGSRPKIISFNLSNNSGTNNNTTIYFNGHVDSDLNDICVDIDGVSTPYWKENGLQDRIFLNISVNGSVRLHYNKIVSNTISSIDTTMNYGADITTGDMDIYTSGDGGINVVPSDSEKIDGRFYSIWNKKNGSVITANATDLYVRDFGLLRDLNDSYVNESGNLIAYFMAKQDSERSRVVRSISSDGGITWSAYSVVVDNLNGGEDNITAGSPTALKFNDTSYKLYYVGRNVSGGTLRILYRNSTDGINFGNYTVVLIPEDFAVSASLAVPWITPLSNGSLVLLMEQAQPDGEWGIIGAISTDQGESFTPLNNGNAILTATAPWELVGGIANPKLIEVQPNTYLLQYNGKKGWGFPYLDEFNVGFAYSSNVTSNWTNWTKYSHNPVMYGADGTYGLETGGIGMDTILNKKWKQWHQQFTGDHNTGSIWYSEGLQLRGLLGTQNLPTDSYIIGKNITDITNFTSEIMQWQTSENTTSGSRVNVLSLFNLSSVPTSLSTTGSDYLEYIISVRRSSISDSHYSAFYVIRKNATNDIQYWSGSEWSGSATWFSVDSLYGIKVKLTGNTTNYSLNIWHENGSLITSFDEDISNFLPANNGKVIFSGEPFNDLYQQPEFISYFYVVNTDNLDTTQVYSFGAEINNNQTEYIPPTPINLTNNTGNFWINHTWQAGSGNNTDTYNVSQNGSWTNGSVLTYNNITVPAHGWSNISIYAYNSSGDGSLNSTPISMNTQLSNNIPLIEFIAPTLVNNSTNTTGSISINTSTSDIDSDNTTALLNWNNSLIGWWRMNEEVGGNNVQDFSGNNFNGTWYGNTTSNVTSGKFGNALLFDANNDYVDAGNNSKLNLTGNFTIEAWIKWNGYTDYDTILAKGDWDKAYTVQLDSTRKVLFITNSADNASMDQLYSISSIPYNVWTHILVIYTSTNKSIYINSIYDISETPGGLWTTPNNLTIGNDVSGEAFNGSIDEVRIWNRVLSTDEINASYNASQYRLNATISNLTNGTYNYTAYVQDEYGAVNSTDTRYVNVSVPTVNYIPPSPINLTYTNGSTWVNHTWSAGIGNVTNSYNISHNGTWTNGSTNAYYNATVGYSAWSNISVYAWNSSGSGTLNATPTSQNVQTPSSPSNEPEINYYLQNVTGASLAPTINVNNGILFSVGANQTITNWTWSNATQIDGNGTTNSTASRHFSSVGTFPIQVIGTNPNGSTSQLTWGVEVVEDGGSGTDWDWAYGWIKYPNGTGINGVLMTVNTTPTRTANTDVNGYYQFDYYFVHGNSYFFNATKSGFVTNNTTVDFLLGYSQIVNLTMNVTAGLPAPSISSWANNNTSNASVDFNSVGGTTVEFNVTTDQVLTSRSWGGGAVETSYVGTTSTATRTLVTGNNVITFQGTNANGSTSVLTWTVHASSPSTCSPTGEIDSQTYIVYTFILIVIIITIIIVIVSMIQISPLVGVLIAGLLIILATALFPDIVGLISNLLSAPPAFC